MKKRNEKRRRGFTLVELIVTMALITILSAGIAALMVPTLTTARQSINLSSDRQIARSIMEQLTREVALARNGSVSVTGGGTGLEYSSARYGPVVVSKGANGCVSVMAGGTEIGLEEDAYMGRTAEAAFSMPTADTVAITLTLFDGAEACYTMNETVRLLNKD